MLHPTMLMMSDQHHRVSTYRDITSVPTFLCTCSASYWSSLASNTQSKMADRLLTAGGDRSREKSGYMKMSFSQVQL